MSERSEKALSDAVKDWLAWDKNLSSRKQIEDLWREKNLAELKNSLLKRLEFGTAGLRAEMGAGNAKMNDLTIIQTTQGVCSYMQEKFGKTLNERGVVIGFDSRHNSSRFAMLTANVFLLKGIKVYLFSKITPTPFVPYAVLKYKTCSGIMITASHNPKQDNGYKLYWENGAQIIPPHDTGIARSIEQNLRPSCDEVWKEDICRKSSNVIDPYDDVMQSYFKDLRSYCKNRSVNKSTKLRFTYTPVHGVGSAFSRKAFAAFDLPPFEEVPEQKVPDPEFSTVEYPNPEEGKGVLRLSIRTAEATGCRIILANDPDADRLAVAEKQKDGSWKVFSGNELGALLGWWAWHCYVTENPGACDHSNVYMLSSTVSSSVLKSIAKQEGFSFEDTLTGFKWMGNRSNELMREGKKVLFAFEEAIGFMYGTNVLDKDGVSAMAVAAEFACVLDAQGSTLTQKLYEIYDRYGDHVSNNSYFISHDAEKTNAMFQRLRNYGNHDVIVDNARGHRYPKKLSHFEIVAVRDLTTGFDSRIDNGKATLPSSASSHMITFYFSNDIVMTLRTSGTEPKIKYYSEICGKDGRSRADVEAELNELIKLMCEDFYQPCKNGFLPRPT